MSASKRATPEFVSNFGTVTKHYKCPPSEIEEMKKCARADMVKAEKSFSAMAREIAQKQLAT